MSERCLWRGERRHRWCGCGIRRCVVWRVGIGGCGHCTFLWGCTVVGARRTVLCLRRWRYVACVCSLRRVGRGRGIMWSSVDSRERFARRLAMRRYTDDRWGVFSIVGRGTRAGGAGWGGIGTCGRRNV